MSQWKTNLTVIVIFLTLVLLLTYPLILNMGSSIKDPVDPLLSAWIMSWNIQQIMHMNFQGFFDANIFFPYKKTIAYSEFMLTQSLAALPFFLATKNIILAQNIVILLSLITSALGMFFLARYLTKNTYGGFIAGLIYAFSPYMFGHISHLHMIAAGGIPFAFLFLHKFFDQNRVKHWFLFGLFFLLQALANGHYALYLALFAGLYILIQVLFGQKYKDLQFWRRMAVLAVIIFIVMAPVYHQYMSVKKDMGFVREISGSADLASYLAVPPFNRLYGSFTQNFKKREGMLFPGIGALLLALFALGSTFKKREKSFINTPVYFYGITLTLAFLFTLGSKGPYLLLYKYVPGFKGVRVASRFGTVVMFALAVLAAYGIKFLFDAAARRPGRTKPQVLVVLLIIFILLEYLSVPVPWKNIPVKEKVPEIYQWLAAEKEDFVIVELPLPKPKQLVSRMECPRIYFSTFHWKRMINGYAGYFPPLYKELRWRWQKETLEQNILDLRQLGVKYVIVHASQYKAKKLKTLFAGMAQLEGKVQFIKRIGEAYLYELMPFMEDSTRVVPRNGWTIHSSVNRSNLYNVIDGDLSTRWHIHGFKFETSIQFDLGRVHRLKGFSMMLGQDPSDYSISLKIELSRNGTKWEEVARTDNRPLL